MNQEQAADAVAVNKVMLDKAPEGAKDVLSAKKAAKEGDEIVIRGKIGGEVKPFIGATMLVTDLSAQSCDTKPDDDCKTPWDYCCDPPEKRRENYVLVQIVGPDGKTLKTPLESYLKPLDVVIVKGKVQKADANNFTINASGIFVEQKHQPKKG